MSLENVNKKADAVLPPRAGTGDVTKDLARNVATTTTGVGVDIQEFSNRGCYITLISEGAAHYITFSDTQAHAAALDGTAVGSAQNVCWYLPADAEKSFILEKGIDKFLGYKSKSGAGFLRYTVSSPGTPQGGANGL